MSRFQTKDLFVLFTATGVGLVVIYGVAITQSSHKNSHEQNSVSAQTHKISCLADSITFQPGVKGGLKEPSVRIWCANGDRYSFTPSSELPWAGDSTLNLPAWKVTAFYYENGVNQYLDSLAIPEP